MSDKINDLMKIRKMYLQEGQIRYIWIESNLFGLEVKIEEEGLIRSFFFRNHKIAESFYNWFN